jgi:hypothetical protein
VIPRLLVGCRVLAGGALLAAPEGVLERLSRHPAGVGERRAARLLGARNILEGAVVATHPRRGWLLAGAAIDSAHALSMIALAAARPAHRRLAAASALAAIATATAGFLTARDARPRGVAGES